MAMRSSNDMNLPKTVIITGGTSGIGLETGRILMQRISSSSSNKEEHQPDWRIVLVSSRPPEDGNTMVGVLNRCGRNLDKSIQVDFWSFDLSRMAHVYQLAQKIQSEVQSLSALILCAGVMLPRRQETPEGIEQVFALQYLSRWFLIKQLFSDSTTFDKDDVTVINVSAGGQIRKPLRWNNLQGETQYSGTGALKHESIANDMQMLKWSCQLTRHRVYCYGPFLVADTNLFHSMSSWFRCLVKHLAGPCMGYKSQQAAQDIVTLVFMHQSAVPQEKVLVGRKLKGVTPTKFAGSPDNQDRLWSTSDKLVQDALQQFNAESPSNLNE